MMVFSIIIKWLRDIFSGAGNLVIKIGSENNSNNTGNISQQGTQNSQNITINNGTHIVSPMEKNAAAEAILKQVSFCKYQLTCYRREAPKYAGDITKSFKKDINKLDTSITTNAKLFGELDQKDLKKQIIFLQNLDIRDKESLPSEEVFQPIENTLNKYKIIP